MSDDTKYPSQLAERFQIRLPAGLRDRIKVYAEAHGRSMNAEIIRLLEREFPEPWNVAELVSEMLALIGALDEASSREQIAELSSRLKDTVEGIASGRVRNIDPETRAKVSARLRDFYTSEENLSVDYLDDLTGEMDDGERESFLSGHSTAKHVDLDDENEKP